MALTKPPLATVEPGRPITAQGWNAIIDGLSLLYDAVMAFGSGNFQVSVQAGGRIVDGVEIVAEPVGDGLPVAGLPLFGTRTTYLVTGVSDGAWRVHVSAPGFTDQTVDVTVPANAPVTVNLARAASVWVRPIRLGTVTIGSSRTAAATTSLSRVVVGSTTSPAAGSWARTGWFW